MSIHFVCTGNIYRSRIAEAYLRSKKIPGLLVSSSGTQAFVQHRGSITWYAQRLLFRHNLIPHMSNEGKETTNKYLLEADIVIFFCKSNYEYCRSRFHNPKKYEIWEVPDLDDADLNGKPLDIKREAEIIKNSENIFIMIKKKVDDFKDLM